MLRILGKYRSRSSCQYQKLSHHQEKVTTKHNLGKKLEGRSKGFRLNRPRRLVLKALVLPRRILSIYARITDKMNREVRSNTFKDGSLSVKEADETRRNYFSEGEGYMRSLVCKKMWWVVHGRTNKRNLHRDCENKSICDLGKDLDEILKGRLETIEEEPEAEERERLGESQKPMLVKAKMKVEKCKTIVKAKMKSGQVFYMLCIIGLASRRASTRSLCLIIAPFLFLFLTVLASTEPPPTPILRHDNQSSDLVSAIADMIRESYNGFGTLLLLHVLNDTNFYNNQEITFLMPSDDHLSQADMSQESLETFILRHTIPAWLMINHLLRFPNKTLVPCSIPDKMFVITKSGRSGGLYVNNARIVSPNICRNSRVACHGVSNVITFTEDSLSKAMLSSPVLSSVPERITSSRH
ncbi:hypothetical protein IGI04_024443 [Brassica rapa subsp. trilocularis]|uniref:FAS1 domain-containing protein n=1 Tax=Brassica rapa subsp. trilocularis TaxID=1813537 RepID=A0ABQ7M980_BRACM|nr:hypothetical protein IGI04_024443 [Brassica rapa subsp. trilocularis]